MDYRALGLKVGLEIHQQLDTHKLFCDCPSRLTGEEGGIRFQRRLRPTQSELGEVDAAAIEEARRHLTFVYEATENTCLVEADEEPPHHPNEEALDIALEISLLLGAKPVREVDFMRKLVIDGSNTSGFQRSALVAMDGSIEVNGKRIGVPTILLEEDAARKVGESTDEVAYLLDRLGIPLVEISTTPDMQTPEEAREVALAIGSLIRATRKVMRGIGTIREDVNISVRGGARCEIKGVQELRLIETFVVKEAERQLMLVDVAKELQRRSAGTIPERGVDLTHPLSGSPSKVIQSALKKGGKVLGWALPKFAGLLKGKLGPELAAHARVAGVGGIFHSDELPAYGVTQAEVETVGEALALGAQDAFVLVAGEEAKCHHAIEEMRPRAFAAVRGVPEETRDPRPDGTSVYSRPLPGKARMYPETDVPPIRVHENRLRHIEEHLPERPEVAVPRLATQYQIDTQRATQLFQEGRFSLFETITKEFGEANTAASALTYTAAELQREGFDVDSIPEDNWREMFSLLKAHRFAKEAIPDLLREMARKGVRASDAVMTIGVQGLGRSDVEKIVDEILDASDNLVKSKGMAAEKTLMGRAMEKLRGHVDGRLVSEVMRSRLHARLETKKEREEK
jgi:glutamyl-tRNA(Gln) amidotransferase subunit E